MKSFSALRRLLGVSWGIPGALLETESSLELFGAPFETLLGPLGAPLGALGGPLGRFGPPLRRQMVTFTDRVRF